MFVLVATQVYRLKTHLHTTLGSFQQQATLGHPTTNPSLTRRTADDDNDEGRRRPGDSPSPHITVFYNIFIPLEVNKQANALRIVQEQLQQIKNSYANKAMSSIINDHRHDDTDAIFAPKRLEVRYVTLGAANVLTTQLMQQNDYCGDDLSCQHLEHVPQGREVHTLAYLHDFCVAKMATTEEADQVANRTKMMSNHQHASSFFSTSSQSSTIAVAAKEQHRVVYLHNKGSLHRTTTNDNWRFILTEAALSELCLRPNYYYYYLTVSNSSRANTTTHTNHSRSTGPAPDCNLCGLQFFTQWTNFIPGNMFAATCDYIQQLIPPHLFQERLEQAIGQVMLAKVKDQIQFELIPGNTVELQLANFGLDRYSDEHWIASHPTVRPCDCDASGYLWRYQQHRKSIHDLQLAPAPRHRGPPFRGADIIPPTAMHQVDASKRLRDYVYLPGNLIKWHALYQQVPPPDSWAWTWFPDGALWRDAVAHFGGVQRAIEMVTRPYVSRSMLQPDEMSNGWSSYNAEEQASPTSLRQSAWYFGNEESHVAVFYDAYIPPAVSGRKLLEQTQLIKNQFAMVAKDKSKSLAHLNAKILVSTAGHAALEQINPCSDYLNIDCFRSWLPHQHNQSRISQQRRTFQNIQSYCHANPGNRVVYVHNQPPKNTEVSIIGMTAAAIDKKCLDAVHNDMGKNSTEGASTTSTCNVCGLLFSALPKLIMAGNMWASDCSYIGQLLPPSKAYFEKMNDFAAKSLVLKLKGQLNFLMLPERSDRLGLYDYALDGWVSNHPSLRPCDLSAETEMNHWHRQSVYNFSEFRVSAVGGGNHSQWAPSHCDPKCHRIEAKILQDKDIRKNEFYLLSGNLLKWYSLYDMAPPSSSWVWKAFPDGLEWLDSVKKYASDGVRVMTAKRL